MDHLSPLAFAGPPAHKAPDHPPMQMLRRAGLRVEEEQFVYEAWDRMGPADRTEWYETVMSNLDTDELRRQIEELRATGWSQPIADETPAVVADESPGVDEVPDGTVDQVLEWVGDDVTRATAAIAAEQTRHDPPRKTLLEPLEDLSAGR